MNFNSGGVNPQNTNNRFNGFTGRAVQHAILTIPFSFLHMKLSKQQLLFDLYVAFYCSRRGKSKRSYVRKWERNLKENMEQLCDELYNRTYQPQPSKCFIVNYPKKREIFAAMFRDRIVHHLYYNYTHELYERNFIADAYSCIIGRGTHYGINRLKDFCRRESRNYQRKAYVMHLDIRGYFMHIDRHRLLEISLRTLNKMSNHKIEDGRRWSDVRDCITVGDPSDWEGLDAAKSMLNLKPGLGLPIGNLTSQLFSNVYLNEFDQFMKRTMKCRYYGRYVDDAFIVSADKNRLLRMVPQIQSYLTEHLGIELHMGKLHISEVHHGVEFLGAYIKPYRTYISNHALHRIETKLSEMDFRKPWRIIRSVNSYLGIFQHTDSYNIRRRLLMTSDIMRYCVFNRDMTQAYDRRKFYKVNPKRGFGG